MDIHFHGYSLGYTWIYMDIHLNILRFLWISIWISLDFYGYSYIDLLWIFDPGFTHPYG